MDTICGDLAKQWASDERISIIYARDLLILICDDHPMGENHYNAFYFTILIRNTPIWGSNFVIEKSRVYWICRHWNNKIPNVAI